VLLRWLRLIVPDITVGCFVRDLVATGTEVLRSTQYLDEADHLAARIVIVHHGRVIA
jgi:ABC-type multidrug transport system ATPase subunit